jgi:Tol biopolymer transport system component
MEEPINTEYDEMYVSVSKNGNIYFQAKYPDGYGEWDIYCSKYVSGTYSTPQNLGYPINSSLTEAEPCIAPDESYIIISTIRESENIGNSDLYISFQRNDGSWSNLINLGNKINSRYSDKCPQVTKDGKYLFFLSYRPRRPEDQNIPDIYDELKEPFQKPYRKYGVDIYWVSTDCIDVIRGNTN